MYDTEVKDGLRWYVWMGRFTGEAKRVQLASTLNRGPFHLFHVIKFRIVRIVDFLPLFYWDVVVFGAVVVTLLWREVGFI